MGTFTLADTAYLRNNGIDPWRNATDPVTEIYDQERDTAQDLDAYVSDSISDDGLSASGLLQSSGGNLTLTEHPRSRSHGYPNTPTGDHG